MYEGRWLNIGIVYLNGLGTDLNVELALVYLKKSSKHGGDEKKQGKIQLPHPIPNSITNADTI